MQLKIRLAEPADFDRLDEILSNNDMLGYPEIDGKEAMQRVYERMGKYFLVAEVECEVIGMIRGCYDGSRAMIHQLSVDKNYQRIGVGKALIKELSLRFSSEGAPSVSVSSSKNSCDYFGSLGFSDLSVKLLVGFDINELIKKVSNSSS